MSRLIFATFVFVFGFIAFRVLRSRQDRLPGGLGRILAYGVLVLAVGVPALIFAFSVFRIIPAGHVGVKVLFGGVDPVPLREGLNVVWNPLHDVVDMDTRVLKQTATHNAAEILLKRPAIKADIQKDLTAWLAKYGIEMKEAALANIRFDPAYEKAVEAKQIEEQKAEQKRYELVQAQRQAEIAAAQAKGKGDAAREEARGVADALRLKGDAEAQYNAKVSSSLTPTLIQQQYLTRWDGRLPQYSFGGGGAVPFVQIPTGGDGGPRR